MKRFYKQAGYRAVSEKGWQICLDGKPVRTPKSNLLTVDVESLAAAIANEWNAQTDKVVPDTMPLTRLANSVLDLMAEGRDDIVENLANYGKTDLVCYRAPHPPELRQQQDQAWDPFIDWAQDNHNITLTITESLSAVPQPADSLLRLKTLVAAHDDPGLAALHDFVTITGSLVIGLSVSAGAFTVDDAWAAARVDDTYQNQRWGKDTDAERTAARRHQELKDAARFRTHFTQN